MNSDKKILIVDDDRINRAILTDTLQNDYNIIEMTDEENAEKVLMQYGCGIGLVLIDMFLPEKGCRKFLEMIMADEEYSKIPVIIIMSADADNSYVEQMCELGAADFLRRPFSKLITQKRVANIFNLYSMKKQNFGLKDRLISERKTDNSPKAGAADCLEEERRKCDFFVSLTDELWFEYYFEPSFLKISRKGAFRLGVPQNLKEPFKNEKIMSYFADGQLDRLKNVFEKLSAENTYYEGEIQLSCKEGKRWFRLSVQITWSAETNSPVSAFGIFHDIDENIAKLEGINAGETEVPALSSDEDFPRLTAKQIYELMRYFKRMFTIVRLVDPEICMQFSIDSMGKIIEKPYRCYTAWNKISRCENCISMIVAATFKTMTKLEFVNDEIYNVSASYLQVDGKPYVLELAMFVDHDAMFSADDKQKLLNTIAAHNRQLYIDPVTGVYNRRYYDDRLRDLAGEFAVAMLDMDNFKQINDTFGHLAGDAALVAAASAIKNCVRSGDDVIRFGGDEFLIVFRGLPKETIERKLREILHAVENVELKEYSGLKMTISIGGAFEKGKLSQILRKADIAMYNAKNVKNSVFVFED